MVALTPNLVQLRRYLNRQVSFNEPGKMPLMTLLKTSRIEAQCWQQYATPPSHRLPECHNCSSRSEELHHRHILLPVLVIPQATLVLPQLSLRLLL
jgi:hypothetical protein